MTYDIKRWDGVLFGNSISKVPMLYIEPDLNFLSYVKDNNYTITLDITDTKNTYDLQNVVGVVNKSSDIPNCRPNFFEKTNLYVITLFTQWNGYPPLDSLGKIKIVGMEIVEIVDKTSKLSQIMNDKEDNSCDKIKTERNISFLIAILLFLILLYLYYLYVRLNSID